MLKEKYENFKTFVKEHKAQIVTGVVCVGTATVTGVALGKMLSNDTVKEMTKELVDKDRVVDILKSRVDWISSTALEAQCRLDTACQLALNSLQREKDRILFEIDELQNYIAKLDQTKTINVFHRIPEKEKMIETLKEQLKQIEFDTSVIRNQIDFLEE